MINFILSLVQNNYYLILMMIKVILYNIQKIDLFNSIVSLLIHFNNWKCLYYILYRLLIVLIKLNGDLKLDIQIQEIFIKHLKNKLKLHYQNFQKENYLELQMMILKKLKIESAIQKFIQIHFMQLNNSDILDYFIQNSRRESKKLQKYDEQKILLKMKLRQKQEKEKQIEYLQQKILQNNENCKNDLNTNGKVRNNSIKRVPRKGLFIIKEILDKYEDDNTTLIRYSSISSNPLNQIGQILINQKLDQEYEKANSEPDINNQDIENIDNDYLEKWRGKE
ncbi:unnamed protein product [Paramecium sonneborni]|uniref:Uncharacterized protein n=1 Tax=Paramecium sonneborni TaxID=65129 RepID=A0A8S1QLD5_9CILI|nr:unnamed protein product [Paramecium sonneborni]